MQVGPYRFTLEDARNTIASARMILDQMSEGRERVLADARRELDSLEPVWNIIQSATPTLCAAGTAPEFDDGVVASLNTGSGGVPKRAVDSVEVDFSGLVGDVQATRKHHGRPFQALSLWSAEVIDALNAEGHSLYPGAAGENITVSGVDWTDVRPGTRLRIGDVVCDVSSYAVPCKQLAHLFLDRDFGRIHHDRDRENGEATCRVYATVITPGTIRTGDPVALERL
jgi:MOSC domain-containing protein YiiM